MSTNDPAVRTLLRRAKVARIATLSRSGRPSITPLYFVVVQGQIWLGTPEWTLAVREIKADPRVSLLFEVEQNPQDRRVLRITGRAQIRTDASAQRAYNLRVAFKYLLTFGQIRNTFAHRRLLPLRRRYRAQSQTKGQACVIEVAPEQVELLV